MVLKHSVGRIKSIPVESFLKRATLEIIQSESYESYEVSNVQPTVQNKLFLRQSSTFLYISKKSTLNKHQEGVFQVANTPY